MAPDLENAAVSVPRPNSLDARCFVSRMNPITRPVDVRSVAEGQGFDPVDRDRDLQAGNEVGGTARSLESRRLMAVGASFSGREGYPCGLYD